MTRELYKPWLVRGGQPAEVEDLLKQAAERDDVISFAGGLPADDLLPTDEITRTLEQVMAEHGREALQYHWAAGYEPLRAQIVALMRERGVEVGDGELLITHGAQQALDLLARLFLRPGDPLVIESPTYVAAIDVFRLQRPQFCAVGRGEAGLDLPALRGALARARPDLVYLAPAGHNPTGSALTAAEHDELIALADEHAVYLIEDDAYGQIQFAGPRPPLRAHAGARGRVLYVGSFSKVLMPGLRVGWLVAPRELIDQLELLKAAADLQTGSLNQIVVSTYLEHNDLRAHLAGCMRRYGERRDAMLGALERALTGTLRWTRPTSGFSLWAELLDGRDSAALLPTALAHGVAYEPGAAFFPTEPQPRCLRLSYSNHEPAHIESGIERLAAALVSSRR